MSIKRPGITAESLVRNGVKEVTAEEAFQLCVCKEKGMFIPYHNLDGSPILDKGKPYGRLRLKNRQGDKKYHQPADTKVHAYLPKGLNECPIGCDLVLVEGEFKAMSLMEVGIPAIGLPGFYGFQNKGALCSEIQKAIQYLKPSKFLFLGDNDTSINWQFSDASVKLLKLLRVDELVLPRIPSDKPKGIDDCREQMSNKFMDFFNSIIEQAAIIDSKTTVERLAGDLFLRETSNLKNAFDVGKTSSRSSIERRCLKFLKCMSGTPAFELTLKETAKILRTTKCILIKNINKKESKEDSIKEDFLSGRPIEAEKLEPWPEPVDGASVFMELLKKFQKYVVASREQYVAMALWTLYTYCYDAFDISPIMLLSSPEKRCGKSTTRRLFQRLVKNPHIGNGTPAALYRIIELIHPTVIVDEFDKLFADDRRFAGLLNTGHERDGANYPMCSGTENEVRNYSLWSPKIVAGIGYPEATLLDRSICIRLKRKKRSELVGRLRLNVKFHELKQKCLRWAQDHFDLLKEVSMEDTIELDDRAADNWEPLFAIASLLSDVTLQEAKIAAIEISVDRSTDAIDTIGEDLLKDIRSVFNGTDVKGYLPVTKIYSRDLCKRLNAIEESQWGEMRQEKGINPPLLSKILRSFGISSKSIRMGHDTAKGYQREIFEEAWERYLPDIDDERHNGTTSGKKGENPNSYCVTDKACDITENKHMDNESNSCDGVTDNNQVSSHLSPEHNPGASDMDVDRLDFNREDWPSQEDIIAKLGPDAEYIDKKNQLEL